VKEVNMRRSADRNAWILMAARTLLFLLPLMLATPSKAFGYVDSGTGAFVYQAAYAVLLGASFHLRRLLNRIWPKRK
jgi:hypothetical protein